MPDNAAIQSTRRILIVEDIADSRTLLVTLARKALGTVVIHEADTKYAAQALIKKHSYAIALIDLQLQDNPYAGIELIQEIQHIAPATQCVVTTLFNDDRLFTALRSGAKGYLLKSQSNEAFEEKLHGIDNGEPPISPAISRQLLAHFTSQPQHQYLTQPYDQTPPQPIPQKKIKLTPKEQEVLIFITKGLSYKEVAQLIGISPYGVAKHIKHIYDKLQVNNRAEAVIEAMRLGIVDKHDKKKEKEKN